MVLPPLSHLQSADKPFKPTYVGIRPVKPKGSSKQNLKVEDIDQRVVTEVSIAVHGYAEFLLLAMRKFRLSAQELMKAITRGNLSIPNVALLPSSFNNLSAIVEPSLANQIL